MTSIAIDGIAFGAAALMLTHGFDAQQSQVAQFSRVSQAREIDLGLDSWSENAYGYIIPTYDVAGVANGDAHEWGLCQQRVTSAGSRYWHYLIWHYDAASSSLREYDAARVSGGAGDVVPTTGVSPTYSGVIAARAAYLPASSYTLPILGNIAVPDVIVDNGQGDCLGGNRGISTFVDNGNLAIARDFGVAISATGYTLTTSHFSQGPLIVSPAKLVYASIADTSPAAYDAGGNALASGGSNVFASEAHYYTPKQFAIGVGTCGANVTTPGVINGDDIRTVTIPIAPQTAPLDCTITVSDDHGGSAAVEIVVGVVSTPGPAPTPPAPTPTATPFLLDKYFVCSSQPYASDLGPDASRPGYEDYSDGLPCNISFRTHALPVGGAHRVGPLENNYDPSVQSYLPALGIASGGSVTPAQTVYNMPLTDAQTGDITTAATAATYREIFWSYDSFATSYGPCTLDAGIAATTAIPQCSDAITTAYYVYLGQTVLAAGG